MPKSGWESVWALPVSEDLTRVPASELDVTLELWEYGTVAQLLHVGPYEERHRSMGPLIEFLSAEGFAIAGPPEEEYLTTPDAPVQRMIIRYAVRPRVGLA